MNNSLDVKTKLHIAIHSQRNDLVTLKELKALYLLSANFQKVKSLDKTNVIKFANEHPFLRVTIQAIPFTEKRRGTK